MSYLDEIAVPQTQATMNPILLWVIIGVVLLLLLVVGSSILSSGGPNSSERLASFIHRTQALEKLSTSNIKNVESAKLLTANGNMNAILTGIESEITPYAAAASGGKTVKAPPRDSPITLEYEQLEVKLDDARLNVTFDRTYAREVAFQLNTLRAEMEIIYKESNSQPLKSYLETADKDIKTISKPFEDYNG